MKVVKTIESGRKRKSCNCGEAESWELMQYQGCKIAA